MAKQKVIKVKTKHGRSYRRAGHGFSGDEVTIPVSKLKKEQLEIIKKDPYLLVTHDEVDVAEDPAAGNGKDGGGKGDKIPALKNANLKQIASGELAAIAELLPKLSDDQLIELQEIEVKGKKRDDVIAAIEAELDKR